MKKVPVLRGYKVGPTGGDSVIYAVSSGKFCPLPDGAVASEAEMKQIEKKIEQNAQLLEKERLASEKAKTEWEAEWELKREAERTAREESTSWSCETTCSYSFPYYIPEFGKREVTWRLGPTSTTALCFGVGRDENAARAYAYPECDSRCKQICTWGRHGMTNQGCTLVGSLICRKR